MACVVDEDAKSGGKQTRDGIPDNVQDAMSATTTGMIAWRATSSSRTANRLTATDQDDPRPARRNASTTPGQGRFARRPGRYDPPADPAAQPKRRRTSNQAGEAADDADLSALSSARRSPVDGRRVRRGDGSRASSADRIPSAAPRAIFANAPPISGWARPSSPRSLISAT
jgi:hypothetical protein